MGENSKIEWTDHTFNPWWGCTRVGPGCDHCYAATWAKRAGEGDLWEGRRRRTKEANWRQPLRWNREAAAAGRRARVFCASMADVFDNVVDPQWRADLMQLVLETPNLDWLLLTKRVGNVERMIAEAGDLIDYGEGWQSLWGQGRWPDNVWLGATVVNQEEADRDIPKLLATPARVRFLSIEPMLGPIDLSRWLEPGGLNTDLGLSNPGVDWVIVGGESGYDARPMHPAWAREIRDQCAAAGVPFLFKQWGEWLPADQEEAGNFNGDGAALHEWNDAEEAFSIHLPKRKAGRVLDGRTHDGFPV
jgi:protein gp37